MDKAERQKLILLILLIGMAGYFGYNGIGAFQGVSGLQAEAAKLRRERDDLQTQVESAQRMVANLDRIRKEREALEVQLRDLSRRLPGEHESAEVLRNVESLARRAGLIVSQVRRRPIRPLELYTELPMEIGVGGGYQDLVKFADQLSQLPRLVTLNELRLQAGAPTAADGTTGTVSAQLVAVVFQALAGGPAPPGPPAKP